MPVNDELGKRMKECYEEISRTKLMRRIPVIIRIDGKAFHTFTKGFNKPFDDILINSMQQTMKYLCENIQGCVLGYTQSDEISLLLTDYQTLTTDAWFDYKVQKVCSISASMATIAFNNVFEILVNDYYNKVYNRINVHDEVVEDTVLADCYMNKVNKAMFDARCFNIPKEEVANYFYWRQLDASRNSVQMVGKANFSHKELQNKNCSNIQDMLMLQKSINWNNYETTKKRGSCCIKRYNHLNGISIENSDCKRAKWEIDNEIPIFKCEDRKYIEDLIFFKNNSEKLLTN